MRVLSGALAVISLALIGLTMPAWAAPPAPSTGAVRYEELLVSISLNGVIVEENTFILEDDRGMYYAGAADVTAWNLARTGRRSIEFGGQRYFALDDVTVHLDTHTGLLSITALPSRFGLNVVDFQNLGHLPAAAPALQTGGFLNYDIAHHVGTQGSGFSGSFNGAYTILGGVATASAVQPGNGSGYIRLSTAFERDDVPQHTVLRFGDTVEAGGVLPLQRQFGGVQWGTDFALEPSFTTSALPVFAGALATDGTLDVIVNGRQVSQQQIPAGPFVLQNMPVAPGSGSVTLVVRDASGHVQTIVSPYYQSPVLLRRGVSQFEFDAGSQRQAYGIVSNAYAGTFVAAQGRRGVSDELTLGGAVDESPLARTGSLAAAYLIPAIGQLAATMTGRSGLNPGVQQTYTYNYQAPLFGLGAQLIASSPSYRDDVCRLPCTTTKYELVGNAYVATGKSSTLALSFAHGITTDGTSALSTDLTYGHPLWGGRLNIDIVHTGPSPATTLLTATFSIQLGARGWGTVSAARGGAGASGQLASYTQSLPNSPTGFAYGLQAARTVANGTTYAANASEQLAKATISQQFFRGQDTTLAATDIAGSVDFVDHSVTMARSVGQAFGLVELPGYPGIPVYVSGQEVGRTDSHGRLVLPQLQPYQANDIMLAAEDLPIGVDLATSALQITPYGLSPGIARFIVKSAGGVSITLVDSRGAVWPSGTKIFSADGKQSWLVALDGMAYLDGVRAGRQRFTASTAAAACSFEIAVPKDVARLPDLGRTVCR